MQHTELDGHKYMVINQLPTNFRSYDVEEVYIRGLFYPEALSLAKYIGHGKTDMAQLAKVYENAIRGISVYDMEISDFIICVIISSIYTQKSFGWVPNVRCPHIVKNPMIAEMNNRIEVLKEIEEKSEEHENELKELIFNIDSVEPLSPCKGIVTEPIILDDLEFNEPEYVGVLPLLHTINDKKYEIAPLTLRDIIKLDSIKGNENYDEIFYSYSRLIKGGLSDDEKYNVIVTGLFGDIQELEELDKKFKISIKPVVKRCPKCGQEIKIKLGLLKLKAHP